MSTKASTRGTVQSVHAEGMARDVEDLSRAPKEAALEVPRGVSTSEALREVEERSTHAGVAARLLPSRSKVVTDNR